MLTLNGPIAAASRGGPPPRWRWRLHGGKAVAPLQHPHERAPVLSVAASPRRESRGPIAASRKRHSQPVAAGLVSTAGKPWPHCSSSVI